MFLFSTMVRVSLSNRPFSWQTSWLCQTQVYINDINGGSIVFVWPSRLSIDWSHLRHLNGADPSLVIVTPAFLSLMIEIVWNRKKRSSLILDNCISVLFVHTQCIFLALLVTVTQCKKHPELNNSNNKEVNDFWYINCRWVSRSVEVIIVSSVHQMKS